MGKNHCIISLLGVVASKHYYLSSYKNQGSNQGPLDLQSNALPTELFRQEATSHH